jgi:hypothetical protein
MLADLVEAPCEFDAAGLAAAASVYLGLDHPEITTEFFGRGDGSIGRFRGNASFGV